MNHLQKAIQASRQVYWVYARPLDTMDRQFHGSSLAEAERLHAHRLDCGEFGVRRCRVPTMQRGAARHNARVRAHRRR